MPLRWRLKFSLRTLTCVVVLIGAGMGIYVKRHPWRQTAQMEDVNLWNNDQIETDASGRYVILKSDGIGQYLDPKDEPPFNSAWVDLKEKRIVPHELFTEGNKKLSDELEIALNGTILKKPRDPKNNPGAFRIEFTDGRTLELHISGEQLIDQHRWEFSKDSRYLLLFGKTINLYETASGKKLKSWDLHGSISFHPSQPRMLINIKDEASIKITTQEWDLETQTLRHTWEAPTFGGWAYLHNGFLLSMFSYGSNPFASASDSKLIVHVMTPDGHRAWQFQSSLTGCSCDDSFFEHGLLWNYVDTSDYKQPEPTTFHLIEMETQRERFSADREIHSMLSDDGTRIFMKNKILDAFTGKLLANLSEADSENDTRVICFPNENTLWQLDGNKLRCYERVRPEWWWGWFYVPEIYIALMALLVWWVPVFWWRKK